MNPDQTLAELRTILNSEAVTFLDTLEFIRKFQTLDKWLSAGGFPPNDWDQNVADVPNPEDF